MATLRSGPPRVSCWAWRRDDQVKIRGFRVEPQEIEQCLRNSRLYRGLAVVIDPDRRIHAFFAQPEPGATVAALRTHAQQWLPDYMQPGFWVELPDIPHTHHGKVDRRALLALPPQPILQATPCLARTALQAQLSGLWGELLGLPAENVGIDDSFFDLGGHSILLSMLLLRVREQFGRGFALSQFIEVPTVRTLAALMQDEERPTPLPARRSGMPNGRGRSTRCPRVPGAIRAKL